MIDGRSGDVTGKCGYRDRLCTGPGHWNCQSRFLLYVAVCTRELMVISELLHSWSQNHAMEMVVASRGTCTVH